MPKWLDPYARRQPAPSQAHPTASGALRLIAADPVLLLDRHPARKAVTLSVDGPGSIIVASDPMLLRSDPPQGSLVRPGDQPVTVPGSGQVWITGAPSTSELFDVATFPGLVNLIPQSYASFDFAWWVPNWDGVFAVTGDVTVYNTVAAEGLQQRSWKTADGAGAVLRVGSGRIAVTAGKNYLIRAMVRASSVTLPVLNVGAWWYPSTTVPASVSAVGGRSATAGQHISVMLLDTVGITPAATDLWTCIAGVVQAPPGAQSLLVSLDRVAGVAADVWWDDVAVGEVPEWIGWRAPSLAVEAVAWAGHAFPVAANATGQIPSVEPPTNEPARLFRGSPPFRMHRFGTGSAVVFRGAEDSVPAGAYEALAWVRLEDATTPFACKMVPIGIATNVADFPAGAYPLSDDPTVTTPYPVPTEYQQYFGKNATNSRIAVTAETIVMLTPYTWTPVRLRWRFPAAPEPYFKSAGGTVTLTTPGGTRWRPAVYVHNVDGVTLPDTKTILIGSVSIRPIWSDVLYREQF